MRYARVAVAASTKNVAGDRQHRGRALRRFGHFVETPCAWLHAMKIKGAPCRSPLTSLWRKPEPSLFNPFWPPAFV
jgi:hypothetical protein